MRLRDSVIFLKYSKLEYLRGRKKGREGKREIFLKKVRLKKDGAVQRI